jgi:hypothetical protein
VKACITSPLTPLLTRQGELLAGVKSENEKFIQKNPECRTGL